jgi:hypothetical protein
MFSNEVHVLQIKDLCRESSQISSSKTSCYILATIFCENPPMFFRIRFSKKKKKKTGNIRSTMATQNLYAKLIKPNFLLVSSTNFVVSKMQLNSVISKHRIRLVLITFNCTDSCYNYYFHYCRYEGLRLTFKRPSLNTSRSPYGPTLNSAFSSEAYAFG